jgi:Ca2+-binding RTX toxin-like protein
MSARRRRGAGALALAAALACPAAASAGTATVEPGQNGGRSNEDVELVTYLAGPRERNDVRAGIAVNRDGVGTVTIGDTAGVTPGRGCARQRPADVRSVRCTLGRRDGPLAASYAFDFRLGDGNDRAAITYGPRAGRFDGGPGNDTLRAGNGIGSPSAEEEGPAGPEGGVLRGGPGNDTLLGGSRADTFDQSGRGADGADVMRGGRGVDIVTYTGRRVGVHADLQADADDGAPGERDRIVDAENVLGGRGADRLAGSAEDNDIDGAEGVDRIAGRGGNDRLDVGEPGRGRARAQRISGGRGDDYLVGGPGRDLIEAGPGVDVVESNAGSDRILARDGKTDQLACDRGRDRVLVDALDFAERSCERIRRRGTARAVVLGGHAGPLGSVARPYTNASVGCSPDVPVRRCRVAVTISRRGRILGRTRLRLRRGASSEGFVYLNPSGRALVRRLGDRGTTNVRMTAVIRTRSGRRLVSSRVLTLGGLSSG